MLQIYQQANFNSTASSGHKTEELQWFHYFYHKLIVTNSRKS